MRLRALVGSLSILSSYHRVLTSRTVRREITATEATAAVASRQQEQQQLARSCLASPLRSRTSYQLLRPTFCRVHRSLSLSSSRFLSACQREGA